jgi:hypothetical protein
MASIAGFVIGSALASDLSDSERMQMGLVGSLMPSPLVGALIVESLVESEEKSSDDKGKDGADHTGNGNGGAQEAYFAAIFAEAEKQLGHEKRAVETLEQGLLDRAVNAEAKGGFSNEEWESAESDLAFLKESELKLAEDRTTYVERKLKAAKPSDSDEDDDEHEDEDESR